ncbi:glycosyltransferase [Agrobacterium cavarae]|uniref:glycosyltransferase n=1 Tax=Agrobacterium cavarae TaxID=2528239 RepID=UPI000DE0B1BC|nr:glycosyltransferase [Agrobacterium cavarae]
MILLTIGTQLPFDRLVRAVDELSPLINEPIFGQIGSEAQYEPKNFEYCRTMRPTDFDGKFSSARVILSHAGIGTVLSSRRHGKPIVVVPRLAKFGEHRNDHQLATCAQLKNKQGIYVASELESLFEILSAPSLELPLQGAASADRVQLVDGIRGFIRSVRIR